MSVTEAAWQYINHIWNISTIIHCLGVILIIHSRMVTTHQFTAGLKSKTTPRVARGKGGKQSNEGAKKKKAGKKKEKKKARENLTMKTMC